MADISWNDFLGDTGSTNWADMYGYGNDLNNVDWSGFGDAATQAGETSGSTDWSWLSNLGSGALNFLGSSGGGGAALGGLLGYLGSKNTPASTTTTQEPWLAQQPFLLDAFNQAAAASKANPQVEKANQNYTSVLNGPTVNPMLGLNNPYLNTAIDNANADVTRAMMPAMNQANRASGSYGNSGVSQTYGKALTDAYSQNATNMRMQDYSAQQGLQQNAVNNTLGFTTNANTWASQPAANYAATVRGNYGNATTTPLYSNPYTSALGGAMAGYQMSK